MTEPSRSLLDFIDSPILVGDPDGRVVYVNPAFESSLGAPREQAIGDSLANLFEGGGREAMLRAVMQVCGGGTTERFRIRAGGNGWITLASPVEAQEGRVGVILLFTPEPGGEDRLHGIRREVLEPLDELADCLGDFAGETGGRRDEQHRVLLADGLRLIERMRKWACDLEVEVLSDRSR